MVYYRPHQIQDHKFLVVDSVVIDPSIGQFVGKPPAGGMILVAAQESLIAELEYIGRNYGGFEGGMSAQEVYEKYFANAQPYTRQFQVDVDPAGVISVSVEYVGK